MDRWQRWSARLPKSCWQAAKGVLSLPQADAVSGAVFDDMSTNAHECGGVGVLLVDDEVEVAEIGCDPTSLSIWAGMVVPESIWGWLELVTGDGCVRVLPSRSEGLRAKS